MVMQATSPFEASMIILRYIWHADLHHCHTVKFRYNAVYVYFDPKQCRYSFEELQRTQPQGLIKRYEILDAEDAIRITATKHPFVQILLGATLQRKLFDYRQFFAIVKTHYEWFV